MAVARSVRHEDHYERAALPIRAILRRHVVIQAVMEHAFSCFQNDRESSLRLPCAHLIVQAGRLAFARRNRRQVDIGRKVAVHRLKSRISFTAGVRSILPRWRE